MTVPARCAFTLPQGARLPWLKGTGKYQVCVTPSQARKLWKSGAHYSSSRQVLGCGAFACVYSSPQHDRVIKITSDRSDVESLRRGQGIPFVPKVFKTYRLDSNHRWTSTLSPGPSRYYGGRPSPIYPKGPPAVYAMEIERVRALSGSEKGKWSRRMSCVRYMIRTGVKMKKPYRSKAPSITEPTKQMPLPGLLPALPPAVAERAATEPIRALSWMPKRFYPEMEHECCPKQPRETRKACQRGVRQLAEAARLLRKRGIDPKDLHAGNIGQGDDGRWKLIDLGQSAIARTQEPRVRAIKG